MAGKPSPIPKPHPAHPMVKRTRRIELQKHTPIKYKKKSNPQSKYDPKVCPAVAFYTIFMGGTLQQVATSLRVAMPSITEWRKKYPEFDQACRTQLPHILGDAVHSLIKRAMGYVVEDTKVIHKQEYNKTTGELFETRNVEVIRKHIPADVTAIMHLLANRDSEWRRSDSPIQAESDPTKAMAQQLTTDQLEEIVRKSASTDMPTPCYSNWDAMGTEEEFVNKLKTMHNHNPEKPS